MTYFETTPCSDATHYAVNSASSPDVVLMSEKAEIASQFFAAFAHRDWTATPNDEATVTAAAVSFVQQLRLGKWDLFILLDGAMPGVNILLLFHLLSTLIGPDPEHHLFLEGDDGILACHDLLGS